MIYVAAPEPPAPSWTMEFMPLAVVRMSEAVPPPPPEPSVDEAPVPPFESEPAVAILPTLQRELVEPRTIQELIGALAPAVPFMIVLPEVDILPPPSPPPAWISFEPVPNVVVPPDLAGVVVVFIILPPIPPAPIV